MKVADKIFVGKNILHVQVFKRNDKRTVYNMVYRSGKKGPYYIKRFCISSITRDRLYNLTKGVPGSKVMYFTANPNGEAEVIKATLEPTANIMRRRSSIFLEKDFSEVPIRGRDSQGTLFTKKEVNRIGLKSHGHSTLGGRMVWFDPDVNRLNYDEHGTLLGEFNDGDLILVVLQDGTFYTTNFDVNNHYEDNILRIEKFKASKVWTSVIYDFDNGGYPFIKRFCMESSKKKLSIMGENKRNQLALLTDTSYPMLQVTFGGNDAKHEPMKVDVDEFCVLRSYKTRGRRLTILQVEAIEELEPKFVPEPAEEGNDGNEETAADNAPENLDPDAGKSEQQIIDEMTGQLNLFD